MGAHALDGRDKLTLVTSPGIGSFGLWAEQLVAESTGKEGAGIVPVAGEPLRPTGSYGADRLFVYLRLEGDANGETDEFVDAVESAGHPVVRADLADVYDLGAELFRWQFATAVAGSILGVNPFDQPDVRLAKERTDGPAGRVRGLGASAARRFAQPRRADLARWPRAVPGGRRVHRADARDGRRPGRAEGRGHGPLPGRDDRRVRPALPALHRPDA